jgi:uncharacterized protein YidB (DUF937 family)
VIRAGLSSDAATAAGRAAARNAKRARETPTFGDRLIHNPGITLESAMSLLNDVIQSALREQNVPQLASSGSSSLADALRSLLAPATTGGGAAPDAAHLEPDALQQLLARFERSGCADLVGSWIGNGRNEPIAPHQVGEALGAQTVSNLEGQTGLPREHLLDELAGLLPSIVDRLTPQGKLPGASA